MAKRLGLLGGTFDPIHIGHLIIASHAAEALDLDRVLFMPAHDPPHKAGDDIAPTEDRVAMVTLAIAGDDRFELSDYDLRRGERSFTSDLLERLAHDMPRQELFFIAGSDSLKDFPTWNKPQQILDLAQLAIAARPETEINGKVLDAMPNLLSRTKFFDAPLIDISSSRIRERVRNGSSIRYLVPAGVEQHIRDRELYRQTDQ